MCNVQFFYFVKHYETHYTDHKYICIKGSEFLFVKYFLTPQADAVQDIITAFANQDLNQRAPKYEAGVLTIQLRCSAANINKSEKC
jgi:hypothetical protein